MKIKTLLLLGRTSNLPTVWTNMLAGAVLSGVVFGANTLGVLLVAGSAFYEGGMFLNDAFDAEIDAKQRPNRPIPSGQVARSTVYLLGFGLLSLGILLLTLGAGLRMVDGGPLTILAGAFTCAAILVYNRWHKGHAWSPIVMGACRAGLYATAALAVSGQLSRDLLLGAGALLLYIVGLTHIARFENGKALDRAWVGLFVFAPLLSVSPTLVRTPAPLPILCAVASLGWSIRSMGFALRGQIPRAVVTLIAGVALVDALFVALHADPLLVLPIFAAFLLTLKWQQRIPGT